MPQRTLELRTHDPDAQLRFCEIERFEDGSGYACVLEVESRGFSGRSSFYFEEPGLRSFLDGLSRLDNLEVAEAMLKGQWDSDFVRFSSDARGRCMVQGQLSEQSDLGQELRFAFCTDQTVLQHLANGLRQWLAA